MASMKATAVSRSTKPLMREALLVFEGERPAMPGTLHHLPAHIKRVARRRRRRAAATLTSPWALREALSALRRLYPEHDEHDRAD
jgi:hypothetical protein